MEIYFLANELNEFIAENKSLFVKTEPEVPDFTINSKFKIFIFGNKKKLEIEICPENIMTIVGLFDATIFNKDLIKILYFWNIKSFASYFLYFSKKYLKPTSSIIDLKIIEGFLGLKKSAPENFSECINRMKRSVECKAWQSIYKSIHLPLSLETIPSIETSPLLNEESRRIEFPYYEIEGQSNGRMNCLKKFAKSYLPHNMGPEIKSILKPRGYETIFLCSDFRHCEVTVLQWLSKDERLQDILNSGKDLYEVIYEEITGDSCNSENKRNLSKKMFLPVMYGCGTSGLSKNLNIQDSASGELINRIKKRFKTAYDWMQSNQDQAKKGEISDYFGRPRKIDANQSYLARNFCVQGVAATACQEKLIMLNRELDKNKSYIVFSIHDGFGLVCKIKNAHETYKIVKQICEKESDVCPGLKMKTEIKFGKRLNQMKIISKN